MVRTSQTAVISARVSPHLQSLLQQEAGLLGLSLSAVVEEVLTRWLETRLGEAGVASARPAEPEPMTTTDAIRAFHRALRVDDAMKDVVAESWLEFRRAEAARRPKSAGNVVALARRGAVRAPAV
jgi:hypothetical protein